MEIDQTAPATAAEEVHIRAPIELAWRILADVGNWPRWNPSIQRVDLSAPVARGVLFCWKADGVGIRSRLEEVSPFRRVAWSGRTPGIRALRAWTFEETENGTYVKTGESFEGLAARLLRRPLGNMLRRSLYQGLSALKREAERRAIRGDR